MSGPCPLAVSYQRGTPVLTTSSERGVGVDKRISLCQRGLMVELGREEAQEPRQPCREGRQVSGPWPLWSKCGRYRGTSLIKNCLLPEPYSRTMPRALRWALGRGAVSHERGNLLQGRPSSTRPPAGTESGSSFDEKKRRNPASPAGKGGKCQAPARCRSLISEVPLYLQHLLNGGLVSINVSRCVNEG